MPHKVMLKLNYLFIRYYSSLYIYIYIYSMSFLVGIKNNAKETKERVICLVFN